eukprot:scaffold3450_cov114-Cylindrotheca_fusiformis.AAC.35
MVCSIVIPNKASEWLSLDVRARRTTTLVETTAARGKNTGNEPDDYLSRQHKEREAGCSPIGTTLTSGHYNIVSETMPDHTISMCSTTKLKIMILDECWLVYQYFIHDASDNQVVRRCTKEVGATVETHQKTFWKVSSEISPATPF